MIPTELFHYTSASTALEKILLNQQIKVGLIKCVNDPRESKDWTLLPKFTGVPKGSLFAQQLSINQEFTKIKQAEWKVICFAISNSRYKRHPKSHIDEGFLYGSCKSRMWASYGENHKGVCLKFNGRSFDKQIRMHLKGIDKSRKVYCGKVKYADYGDTEDSVSIDYVELLKIGVTNGLRRHLRKYRKQFFLSKSTDWKTESEFRWLVNSENENKEAEFLPIKGIIEEVIIGADFSTANRSILFELCKILDIPFREMIWTNGFPFVSDYTR